MPLLPPVTMAILFFSAGMLFVCMVWSAGDLLRDLAAFRLAAW
jgi:hypothetical protein